MNISNKRKCFGYKGECGVCGVLRVSRHLKEDLAWDKDKQFQFISSIMSFKIITHITEELKNKADLSL